MITNNKEETQQFAKQFAQELHGGDIVLLFGNLGAGKTTFTQGVAQGLGIVHRIVSPTFIIMRSYVYEKAEILEKMHLYHIDLYRIEQESDIEQAGIRDIMGKKQAITVIEWPEKMGSLLPSRRIEIHFTILSDDQREITIKKYE